MLLGVCCCKSMLLGYWQLSYCLKIEIWMSQYNSLINILSYTVQIWNKSTVTLICLAVHCECPTVIVWACVIAGVICCYSNPNFQCHFSAAAVPFWCLVVSNSQQLQAICQGSVFFLFGLCFIFYNFNVNLFYCFTYFFADSRSYGCQSRSHFSSTA